MLLKLNKGPRQFIENREIGVLPPDDERYTVKYIERESMIILQYLSRSSKKDFGNVRIGKGVRGNSEIDRRIMRRWGIN